MCLFLVSSNVQPALAFLLLFCSDQICDNMHLSDLQNQSQKIMYLKTFDVFGKCEPFFPQNNFLYVKPSVPCVYSQLSVWLSPHLPPHIHTSTESRTLSPPVKLHPEGTTVAYFSGQNIWSSADFIYRKSKYPQKCQSSEVEEFLKRTKAD